MHFIHLGYQKNSNDIAAYYHILAVHHTYTKECPMELNISPSNLAILYKHHIKMFAE